MSSPRASGMTPRRVAYFISPHGFGHAARSCAVIEAIWERAPDTRFELFTTVPAWFFESSLRRPVAHHPVITDLGLVQKNSLIEDLRHTVRRLNAWLPFSRRELDQLAAAVDDAGCELVICDVSPLGLAVARHAAKPSVLIENFTWDWIYRGYAETEPELVEIADHLAVIFDAAGARIQTEPICSPVAGALRVAPIARRPREGRAAVRRRLGVPVDARLVMLTMGGVEWPYRGVESRLRDLPGDFWLVIPGADARPRRLGRALLLPHRSDYYHPDLIQASDAVIGKLGYSTVAEIHDAGVPFGYVARPTFPESPPVEAWVRRHLPCRRVDAESFIAWRWLEEIEPLLAMPAGRRHPPGGAADAAERILSLLP